MRLNELRDNPGSSRDRKRVGRGIGSGKGKTAGRGVKGQKSRSGVAIKGFEGGQMPIHMRLPKRGFTNILRKTYVEVNIGEVQAAIDSGRLDAKSEVNGVALVKSGLLRRVSDGVRLLGDGEITTAVTFEVAGASASATKAVEASGGSVRLIKPRAKEVDPNAPLGKKALRKKAAAEKRI
ncbi:MAG: 50S ribosomal protein L15 [Chitinophagales bacterium]|nr:50S ribosomal protein L15 [Hyphomicrobiales bacterium]